MGRKVYSPEQIVKKLREAEVLISQGNTIGPGKSSAWHHRTDILSLA